MNTKLMRINEDIQREMSVLLRDVKDPRLSGALLSCVRCEATGDLKHCKVHISVLGHAEPKELRRGFKSAQGFFRSGISRSLNLRNTPELTFVFDDSIEHSVKINSILKDLSGSENGTTDSSDDNG
jgi:ribosome-binding factor A